MGKLILHSGHNSVPGYPVRILYVDLSTGQSTVEVFESDFSRAYVGGAALGIRLLWEHVDPQTDWSDPKNCLFIGSGPLGGTRVGGSGSVSVVTKGALTNGVASSQANGFFGAFLRFSGFDAIIVQGAAPKWVYIYIHAGGAEIRDASHLVGKDTFEVDRVIKEDLHKKDKQVSVLSIGPAGENLVRFACICVDKGHIAAHNGLGAVMGSKRLKAIAVARSHQGVPVKDRESLSETARKILANTRADKWINMTLEEGSVGGVAASANLGFLPIKNYTTTVHGLDAAKLETYSSRYIRTKFKAKPNPCWACSAKHCSMMEISEGKYAGLVFEEPEYEGMAACSTVIGVDDVVATIVLASETDRLGMDVNETGWLIGWVMECYEKGILKKADTDGLEMTWGNGEAVMALLSKIAHRQGFGNVLAEGVMRAAQHVGGEAPKLAIHTLKGNTPRGHDHRVVSPEFFDTCVSSTGTLETHFQSAPYQELGLSKTFDVFDPEILPEVEAKIRGAMIFEDSLVTCRYQSNGAVALLCEAVNAVTGWDMSFEEAMNVGRRAVNLARAFNLLCGIEAKLDAPSPRYGSVIPDGPAAGRNRQLQIHWDSMMRKYYNLMGWDEETSKPLPETLKKLGLDFVIPRLWG